MDILDYVQFDGESPTLIDAYASLIPQTLLDGLRSGELLAVGALLGEMPVGALIFEEAGTRVILRSLFVDAYGRRQGTGTALLCQLEKLLKQVGGIYSMVLALPGDCDPGSLAFLEKNKFRLSAGEKRELTVTVGELAKLTLPTAEADLGNQVEDRILDAFEGELRANDAYLLPYGLGQPPVRRELSSYARKNGKITGAAIIAEERGRLSLAYLYGENPVALSAVLATTRGALTAAYDENTTLYMNLASEQGRKMAGKLFGTERLSTRRIATKSI